MVKLNLNFAQRFNLTNLLAVQEGPLGRTAPFYRILELVRFSDHEASQIKQTPIGINQWEHTAPSEGWGTKDIDIETLDAEKLHELLRDCPSLKTVDHLWAGPVLKATSQGAEDKPTPVPMSVARRK